MFVFFSLPFFFPLKSFTRNLAEIWLKFGPNLGEVGLLVHPLSPFFTRFHQFSPIFTQNLPKFCAIFAKSGAKLGAKMGHVYLR